MYIYKYKDYFILINLYSERHSEEITSEWINSFKDIISSTPFVFTTLGEIANNYESATSESATSTSDVWTYN
jgi:hypothetical protein